MNTTLLHPSEIMSRHAAYVRAHGGNETRSYLGMSQISRPETDLLTDMLDGSKPPTEAQTALFAIGYDMERLIREKLLANGLIKPEGARYLQAEWSLQNGVYLFRGHTDGEWCDGSLLEIKSTTEEKLRVIEQTGQLPPSHFQQVQCYMHYGGYSHCNFFYQARDSGRVLVRRIPYSRGLAQKLTQKAQRVIYAYKQLQIP